MSAVAEQRYGAAEQDDLELLARLAIRFVIDDMAGVGLDPEQPGHLDGDAGLLGRLPDRALGDGLAELLPSAFQVNLAERCPDL